MQQPTIEGNGNGGWWLAMRASSGGSASMRALVIAQRLVMAKVGGGQ